jgi:RNA polymerase sigma-70 factor, ECF subfamily
LNKDNKFIRSLIQSALQGNNSALEQLFNMNLPKVYTLAFRLTANLKSAELLTETVLVEAWKQLSYLRDDATFSSWISSITVYQCLKYLREDENPQHFEMPQLPSKSPLEKTILSLSKNERVSFVLHHFEGYSIDEVSDLLAISRTEAESTIKSGENVVVSRTPDAISEKSLSNRINLIKTDMSPANDIINKAFVTIYRLKSEDEVKEQYLSEKKSRDDSRAEEAKTVKGIAGFFKKKKPKS